MEIQIEILVIGIICLLFMAWVIWNFLATRRARKKYTKEKDIGRECGKDNETKNQKGGKGFETREDRGTRVGEQDLEGSPRTTERPELPIPSPLPSGKNSKSVRGFFRRTRH